MRRRDRLAKWRGPRQTPGAGRDRNWRVWKLRGLYWNSHPLTGDQLALHRANVDDALRALGAEPETERHERLRREEERYEAFRSLLVGDMRV